MKHLNFIHLIIILALNCRAQDQAKLNNSKPEITVGTFSTLSKGDKATINPALSAYWGDYYFENRYSYEAPNSASINAGKRILKKIKHAEIIPMAGMIFGSFKGLTAELQTSLDLASWTMSMDNQYSFEYTGAEISMYFNWTVVRYKITDWIRAGFTTFYDKERDKPGVFDKGVTVALIIRNWALRFYAFNLEIEKRYYWMGLRYTLKS